MRMGCGAGRRRVSERSGTARTRGDIPETGHPSAASIGAEDPVRRLQRDWIAGRITDVEYEAGLDRVYRGRGS